MIFWLGQWARRAAQRFGTLDGRCCVCGELRPVPSETPPALPGLDWRAILARHLCSECIEHLAPRRGGYCPKCGAMFILESMEVHLCADCLMPGSPRSASPPWERLIFYGPYQGELRRLLLHYKFNGGLGLSAFLEELAWLAYALRTREQPAPQIDTRPELIVPIPLHRRRLAHRGYNQSLELARTLAKRTSIPLAAKAMQRTRHTRPQFELTRSERAANIQNALYADPKLVAGKRLLLVDDIMTSGATLREATRSLLAAGSVSVSVLILARTASHV